MKIDFGQKHLLTLQDYSKKDILTVLSVALKLKEQTKKGIPHKLLAGKTLGMIFAKSSTRTRVSFEVGIYQLGGMGLFLNTNDIQLGRGETIEDTAKVLSRMVDGIMIRTFAQKDIDDLAKYGSIPIINGLSDLLHPCQALADIMTIIEYKCLGGVITADSLDKIDFSKLKLAYAGDGNNVAHSLATICSKLGINFSLAHPLGYEPVDFVIENCKKNASASGSILTVTNDLPEAIEDADAAYTDVWSSMGQNAPDKEKRDLFLPYQINADSFSHAKSDAIFLHCLPAHRDEEVTAEVIDGKNSAIFDEAENRLHAQKAVMALLMGNNLELEAMI